MIILHIGKLGSSKSYSATLEVWKHLKSGRDCYVNWKIDFSKYLFDYYKSPIYRLFYKNRKMGNLYNFSTLKEMYGITNGQIYIDEAHTMLNAREFKNTPPEFLSRMSQARKFHTDLHFICQYPAQIENSVRNLCNMVVEHKKYWKLLTFKEYNGEFIDRLNQTSGDSPKSSFKGYRWYSQKLANCYNSYEIIGLNFPPFDNKPVWNMDIFNEYYKQKKLITKQKIDKKLADLKKLTSQIYAKSIIRK